MRLRELLPVAIAAWTSVVVAAEPSAPPMLSMCEISVDPPFELSEYDRRLLRRGCFERLPEFMADLHGDPAHAGPFDLHLQVMRIEQFADHLDPGADNANSGVTIAPGSDFFGTHTITFSAPTSGLSLELVDVEVASVLESVEVRVYASASGGSPLHTVTSVGGSPGTGDGIRTPIALTGFAGDATVRRIEVQRLTGPVGSNAGFAVDNVEYVLGSVLVQPSTWRAVKAVYGE